MVRGIAYGCTVSIPRILNKMAVYCLAEWLGRKGCEFDTRGIINDCMGIMLYTKLVVPST